MSHYYSQSSGRLFREGKLLGTGYAGSPKGKNNPLMQSVKSTGPIPQGNWTIVGPPQNTATHGPFVLRLDPKPGTNTFGRAGFLMHGDNDSDPGNGSEGCIVMGPTTRHAVWANVQAGDPDLCVVASDDLIPAVC